MIDLIPRLKVYMQTHVTFYLLLINHKVVLNFLTLV